MTFHPENETPPVFSWLKFNRDHVSTIDIVDAMAAELGLKPPEGAPKPALVKTDQPAEGSTAAIKRGLWRDPNLQEQVAATVERPVSIPKDPGPEQVENPAVQISIDDSVSLGEGSIDESIIEPSPTLEMPVDDQPEAPPLQLEPTHKESIPEPFALEGKDDDSQKREAGLIRIILAFILLVSFMAVDCHYVLHTTPDYMLAVRLVVFAAGLGYALATAWRAAGKKLVMTLIIIFLFLFHFNNNRPILSLVDKFYHPTAIED